MVDADRSAAAANPEGTLRRFRVGDAVASHAMHAPVFEHMQIALPLCPRVSAARRAKSQSG
jgi:hypothetical protein